MLMLLTSSGIDTLDAGAVPAASTIDTPLGYDTKNS